MKTVKVRPFWLQNSQAYLWTYLPDPAWAIWRLSRLFFLQYFLGGGVLVCRSEVDRGARFEPSWKVWG